jgi:UDP-glucose 4-epimerase
MGEKYLITGGAGFIGSHLAEALVARGHEVWIVDDLSTGSIANLDALRGHERFHYVIDTIMNTGLMAELIDRVDGVFHLAAAVGVKLIFENPVHTIQTNIRGTEIVLELAARKGKKIQLASTSEVYGKGVKTPFAETDDLLLGPTTCARWAYASSKAIDEFLGLAYWNEGKMPVFVTRFFNTVGPRQTGRYGMVIPRFVGMALRGEPLLVYGDGSQTRCFAHVADIVRAVIALMESDAANGQVYNLGNPEEISILDLARRVIERAGSRSEVKLIPFEEAYGAGFEDMARRVPDARKLAGVIPWDNLIDLNGILDSVIEYARRQG